MRFLKDLSHLIPEIERNLGVRCYEGYKALVEDLCKRLAGKCLSDLKIALIYSESVERFCEAMDKSVVQPKPQTGPGQVDMLSRRAEEIRQQLLEKTAREVESTRRMLLRRGSAALILGPFLSNKSDGVLECFQIAA
jgi:hypothetical protein